IWQGAPRRQNPLPINTESPTLTAPLHPNESGQWAVDSGQFRSLHCPLPTAHCPLFTEESEVMKILRSFQLSACFLLLVVCAQAQDANRDLLRRKLIAEIEKIAGNHDGVMGVAIKDLTTGEEILLNDQGAFPTGSSIKIPILVELLKQAAEGKYKLTDQRWVERQDKVGGSGVIVNFGDHTSQLSLNDLATLMIVLSDNTATNMLIDQVGMANVNRTMDELGLKQIRLRRKMIDQAASARGDENTATPREA